MVISSYEIVGEREKNIPEQYDNESVEIGEIVDTRCSQVECY